MRVSQQHFLVEEFHVCPNTKSRSPIKRSALIGGERRTCAKVGDAGVFT